MAIYHLEVKTLKKEKAYNYFKRNFKIKEALYQKDYIFQNIDNLKFWEIACENEQINGRIFRAIELSLPYELSLDENIKLVNEFVETLLRERHYYSLIIKANKNNLKNIFALIVFSERVIDGVEREPENFFRKFCYKNSAKGGARKDPKWSKKSTLYEIRQLWEDILNKYLRINNFDEIKSKPNFKIIKKSVDSETKTEYTTSDYIKKLTELSKKALKEKIRAFSLSSFPEIKDIPKLDEDISFKGKLIFKSWGNSKDLWLIFLINDIRLIKIPVYGNKKNIYTYTGKECDLDFSKEDIWLKTFEVDTVKSSSGKIYLKKASLIK